MNGPSMPGQFAEQQTLRPAELAALCRVHPATLKVWSDAGLIPCLRTLGGHRRYLRRDLEFLPQSGDPQLMTYGELAALMSVSGKTVARWSARGKLTSVILPGGYPRLIAEQVYLMLPGDPQ